MRLGNVNVHGFKDKELGEVERRAALATELVAQWMLGLMPRFMAWKLATGFVITCETLFGAVLAIGVTHQECLGVIQRIRRTPALSFGEPEWLPAESLDDTYFQLLPSGASPVTELEAKTLAAVFGENGEIPTRPLGSTRPASINKAQGTAK
jgi:hypothetical protein